MSKFKSISNTTICGDLMYVCDEIRAQRSRRRLSQKQVADAIHISKETYRKIEAGEIAIKLFIFIKICKAIRLSPLVAFPDLVQVTN